MPSWQHWRMECGAAAARGFTCHTVRLRRNPALRTKIASTEQKDAQLTSSLRNFASMLFLLALVVTVATLLATQFR